MARYGALIRTRLNWTSFRDYALESISHNIQKVHLSRINSHNILTSKQGGKDKAASQMCERMNHDAKKRNPVLRNEGDDDDLLIEPDVKASTMEALTYCFPAGVGFSVRQAFMKLQIMARTIEYRPLLTSEALRRVLDALLVDGSLKRDRENKYKIEKHGKDTLADVIDTIESLTRQRELGICEIQTSPSGRIHALQMVRTAVDILNALGLLKVRKAPGRSGNIHVCWNESQEEIVRHAYEALEVINQSKDFIAQLNKQAGIYREITKGMLLEMKAMGHEFQSDLMTKMKYE